MIGDMIGKIRKEKGMTKTELANLTGINIGHLTHIEKGERNLQQIKVNLSTNLGKIYHSSNLCSCSC